MKGNHVWLFPLQGFSGRLKLTLFHQAFQGNNHFCSLGGGVRERELPFGAIAICLFYLAVELNRTLIFLNVLNRTFFILQCF